MKNWCLKDLDHTRSEWFIIAKHHSQATEKNSNPKTQQRSARCFQVEKVIKTVMKFVQVWERKKTLSQKWPQKVIFVSVKQIHDPLMCKQKHTTVFLGLKKRIERKTEKLNSFSGKVMFWSLGSHQIQIVYWIKTTPMSYQKIWAQKLNNLLGWNDPTRSCQVFSIKTTKQNSQEIFTSSKVKKDPITKNFQFSLHNKTETLWWVQKSCDRLI